MAVIAKISRNLAISLINKFIFKEKIDKKDYVFFARETKILGSLYVQYPNEEFWKKMNLGFQLNSFAYFKRIDGQEELEKQWRTFMFSKKLDKKINTPTFIENKVVEVPAVSTKKLSTLEFIGNN